ncbi:MAG: hypothetical protein JST35_07155 [Armatimonadetes bacterium]|nr:hypothetical protein [Armatimonadota bacterium]
MRLRSTLVCLTLACAAMSLAGFVPVGDINPLSRPVYADGIKRINPQTKQEYAPTLVAFPDRTINLYGNGSVGPESFTDLATETVALSRNLGIKLGFLQESLGGSATIGFVVSDTQLFFRVLATKGDIPAEIETAYLAHVNEERMKRWKAEVRAAKLKLKKPPAKPLPAEIIKRTIRVGVSVRMELRAETSKASASGAAQDFTGSIDFGRDRFVCRVSLNGVLSPSLVGALPRATTLSDKSAYDKVMVEFGDLGRKLPTTSQENTAINTRILGYDLTLKN